MSAFQSSARSLAVMGMLALLCGCWSEGRFLNYAEQEFHSKDGKVIAVNGNSLYHKHLPCVRLKGKLNCLLPLQELTEAELVKLGVDGRQSGPDCTVYEFDQGVVSFVAGKLDYFSFQGIPAPGVVSIAPTKEGPFVSLPAPEREIYRLFGKPNSIGRPSPPPVH